MNIYGSRGYTDRDILNRLVGTDMWIKVINNESPFLDYYYIKILNTIGDGYHCTIVDAYIVENYDDLAYTDSFIGSGTNSLNPRDILLFNEDIYMDDIDIVTPIEYMSDDEIYEAVDRYSAVDLSEYFEGM